MDVTVTPTGPCRRQLVIKVPPDQVKHHVDSMYESAQGQVNRKGFRPGKVPRKLIEREYGASILAEAKESLVRHSFEDACRTHKLQVVGRPEITELAETPLELSKPFEFTVQCEVRPDIELKNVKGIEVRRRSADVTDEDLEGALRQVADQKRTLQAIDEPIGEGDFAKGDILFRNEAGEVVAERKGAQLNARIPIAGTDPEAFAQRLMGRAKDEKIELPITFPPNFEREELRGQAGNVEFTVREVLRVTPPPIDDALAKSFDFESLEALRAELHKKIGEEKQRMEQRRIEDEILGILVNENDFELPQTLVEDQTKHQLAAYEQRLKENNVPEEEVAKKVAEAQDEARKEAERRVRVFFLVDAIARKERIFVTEGDVDVELRKIAAQNSASYEDARKYYEANKLLPDLRVAIMERKVRDFLRENASLTDK